MTDQTSPTAELEADIEAQREQLAETVDQLTHKLDIKTQAKERAIDLKDRATTDTGRPRPELVSVLVGVVALLGLAIWWRRR
jgi:hypothetical protein